MKRRSKPQPKWSDVKAKLAHFDHKGLLGLVHDLYSANKDNQAFLHTRVGLGEDILKPYKEAISRWIAPAPHRNQDTSVTKAKQAISSFKKAIADPAGLAELMVFYCEQASAYADDLGFQDWPFFAALVQMFDQAVTTASTLPADACDALLDRLDHVRNVSHNFGHGVGDDMDVILASYDEHA